MKHRVVLVLNVFFINFEVFGMKPSNFINPDAFFSSLNHREKRYVTYPSGTAIGETYIRVLRDPDESFYEKNPDKQNLLVAIALPVEVPEENLYFSLNFEANYNLPDNITEYYNSDIAKALHSVTRRSTYSLLRSQLSRQGYNGEECLLRLICETSSYDIPEYGLVESIFRIIFKPSKSLNESLPEEYHRAELFGLHFESDCGTKYAGCDTSMLELFSKEW